MTSTPALVIRDARLDELADVGMLTRTAYAAAELGSESYLAHVQDAAGRAASSTLLVAEADGRVVGTVTLAAAGTRFADIARPGEYEFRMLAVDPATTGRGVATALVGACEDRARSEGGQCIVCSVEDKNTPAIRLYERLGFQRAPDRDWSPEPGVSLLVLGHGLAAQR